MRTRLTESLAESVYIEYEASKPEFLVYLMGPYKSYPPYDQPTPEGYETATRRMTLDETKRKLDAGRIDLDADEALALLVSLRQDLRRETGVNAFLATDPGIPTSEMDAATQSIEYTKAATATIFLAPAMGDNLGVGIETGSVCEHLGERPLLEDVLFLGERGIESAMIDAVGDRWHVTVDEFRDYDDCYRTIRAHLRAVA